MPINKGIDLQVLFLSHFPPAGWTPCHLQHSFSLWMALLTSQESVIFFSFCCKHFCFTSSLCLSSPTHPKLTFLWKGNILPYEHSQEWDFKIKLERKHNSNLSILIKIVLNCQSDNSNIPAIYESGSDAWSLSSNCIFLSFSRPCNFFPDGQKWCIG